MDHQKVIKKSEIDAEIEEFIKNNKDVLYKKSSEVVGSRVQEGNKDKRKAIDGTFTKHLITSGMYKFNGLTTVLDKERVINGSKDWMDKLI